MRPIEFANGALADLRVLELGTLIAGPFCGQILGDMGAEVIKIEAPKIGDPMRVWGRFDEDKVLEVAMEQAAGNPAAVICDVSADSIAQALRVMLTLPPPGPASGFGLQTTESLAAGLRGLIAVKGSNASRSTQASSTLSA